ncbi:hypothetical protein J113_17125 [Mycobacterium tuberculosis CAS/NITR204]|uniref:Uncharacterized protein n=1 Tax=Mycobacterium tuberculosis CAS/NITR204 TaxID=1310114 RepID=R4MJ14_MYCTX|nr:hypothetical protein J113_17125 [Mycobacterium tuberculosis CAS/NITR204]
MGPFVLGENVDTPLVALRFRPRRGDEGVDYRQCLGHRVHAAADADQLGVVVLASQRRGLTIQASAQLARDLVGGDLLPVARSAQHDAQAARIGDSARRCGNAECRVVVVGVVAQRAAVDRLVAGLLQVLDDPLLELISGVVGPQVDAHARHCARHTAGRRRGRPPIVNSATRTRACSGAEFTIGG